MQSLSFWKLEGKVEAQNSGSKLLHQEDPTLLTEDSIHTPSPFEYMISPFSPDTYVWLEIYNPVSRSS